MVTRPTHKLLQLTTKDVPRRTLIDTESFATTLLVLLLDFYGTELTTWAPDTVRMQIADDFGVQMPEVNFDKLMAAITVLTTNFFYKSLQRFIPLANALCGSGFSFNEFDKADVAECAWSITEAWIIDAPDDSEKPFDLEIRHYLTHVLDDEGFMMPPAILRLAFQSDRSAFVHQQHGHDQELFTQIHAAQQQKVQSINSMVEENLVELIAQIKGLPLKNGKTDKVAEKIVATLRTIKA